MAHPLKYTPVAHPEETAHEKLEELLETLHEAGVLRLLDGFFGQFEEVTEVALEQVNTPVGRNAISNLLILLEGLGDLDPDHLQAFWTGTRKGLETARHSLETEPPSLLGLLATLRDEDTRRGLNALLLLLQGIGRFVPRDDRV